MALAAGTALLLALAFLGQRYLLPRSAAVLTVGRGAFRPEITGPGSLDALDKAAVSSSLQGVITVLNVDRNDPVRAGQILAEVNAQDLRAEVRAAESSLEAARKAVEAARSDRAHAEAVLANARATLQRQRKLLRSGTTSRASLDAAEATALQAEADHAKAEHLIQQSLAEQAALEATLEARRALLEEAMIRAPIDGLVTERSLNLGDLVSPGSTILEIADPASLVLTARFDESAIASVGVGQPARVRFVSEPRSIVGRVRRLSRKVDSETREFTADIALQALPTNWALGQRGTAAIAVGAEVEVVALPLTAIGRRDGRPGVWLVEQGRAVWRALELGGSAEGRVAVLQGLEGGERLLAEPAGAYRFMPVSAAGGEP